MWLLFFKVSLLLHINIKFLSAAVSVIAEYGGCFDNSSVSGLCYWFTSNINITEYSPACNVSASCNTSMCNEFVPMPECSSDPPENGIFVRFLLHSLCNVKSSRSIVGWFKVAASDSLNHGWIHQSETSFSFR